MTHGLVSSFPVSGERFSVLYRLVGNEAAAYQRAGDICLEQTVELPDALVPDGMIRAHILGQVESFEARDEGGYSARISYAVEIVGRDLVQLLNVLFGNISLKAGIRAERLDLPESLLQSFRGPRFGRPGLRALLGVPHRPLLCTALKPLGLSAEGLADWHTGSPSPGSRLSRTTTASPTKGLRLSRAGRALRRIRSARQPGDRPPRYLRPERDGGQHRRQGPLCEGVWRGWFPRGARIDGPGCDALSGGRRRPCSADLVPSGVSGDLRSAPGKRHVPRLLFGQLPRLAGADGTIYPNFGGRFGFSRDECVGIVRGTELEMGPLKPVFPTPGGGMSLERVPEMLDAYGRNVILFIGGGLITPGWI